MIRFATLLAALPQDPAALPAYLAAASDADRAAADALLSGNRPRRLAGLDALLHWSAEVAGVSGWLVTASFAASGDRAEVAALLLPPATGTPPGLAEVTAALTRATPITAHATLLALWSRLPPLANLTVNRLASGTFRTSYPVAPTVPDGPAGSVLAVMILAAAARPEITVALWQDGTPIPIARLPLTLPQTPEIMKWVRANIAQRFGPVRQVAPVQVFRVSFAGLARNPRRKSGYELLGAQIVDWLPDLTASDADPLATLHHLAAQNGL